MQKGIFERPSRITMFDFCYIWTLRIRHFCGIKYLSKLAKKIKHCGTLLRKKCHPAAILLLFESEGINSFVNACFFFLERPPVVLWTPFFHQKESFGFLDTKKEGPKGLFSSPDAGLSGLFRKWNKVVERVDN